MDPFFHTGLSISDSLKTVRKSVLIYETIINYLLNLGNSLYSDIIQYENNLGKKLTDSELNNYITTAKKHDKKHIPLYFALMSIYNNYDNYILYLHNIKS